MKISKRKLDILFIFIVFILIQTISFATYQTAVLGKKDESNEIEKQTKIEEQEVIAIF